MSAGFYATSLRRYWKLALLPLVVTILTIVAVDRLQGPTYQTTVYFLVSSPYGLSSRDYTDASTKSNSADDLISSPFDFANIANSLQVASRTIDDLKLPVHSANDLFSPSFLSLSAPSVQVQPGQPAGDAATKGLLTQLLGTSGSGSSAGGKADPTTHWVELIVLAHDPNTSQRIATSFGRNAVTVYRDIQARAAAAAQTDVQAHIKDAESQLDAANAALANFEGDHHLVGDGEFQSAQAQLDSLQHQRLDLLASGHSVHAIDREITNQKGRISELSAILPEYRKRSTLVDERKAAYQHLLELADRFGQLHADALSGAGVSLVGAPYTVRLPGKTLLTLAFGALMALLFGASLALGAGYLGRARALRQAYPDWRTRSTVLARDDRDVRVR